MGTTYMVKVVGADSLSDEERAQLLAFSDSIDVSLLSFSVRIVDSHGQPLDDVRPEHMRLKIGASSGASSACRHRSYGAGRSQFSLLFSPCWSFIGYTCLGTKETIIERLSSLFLHTEAQGEICWSS